VTEANKTVRKPSREEGAFLDLLRTTDILTRGIARVLKPEDLSMTQFQTVPGTLNYRIAPVQFTPVPSVRSEYVPDASSTVSPVCASFNAA